MGAGAGHVHEDTGNVILECNGQPVLIDIGRAPYSSPQAIAFQQCQYHNMLCPASDSTRPAPIQPPPVNTVPRIVDNDRGCTLTIDCSDTWGPELEHWQRSVHIHHNHRKIEITDRWACEAAGVLLHWITPLKVSLNNGRITLLARRHDWVLDVSTATHVDIDDVSNGITRIRVHIAGNTGEHTSRFAFKPHKSVAVKTAHT